MKFSTLIFLAVFSFTSILAKIEMEDAVLVLTKDNFDEAIEQYEYILVEFYAPWCTHCIRLAPEYAQAAKKLEELNSPIKLAKVDAIAETELAEKHLARAFPTLTFFRKKTPIQYNGGRKAADIVNWVIKKSGPSAKPLTSVDEAKAYIDANEVSIVAFFKDVESEGAKVFMEVSNAVDDTQFGISSSDEVMKEYDVQDGQIVLFKKFDEGKRVFTDELNAESLQNFISIYSLPLVCKFNQDTAKKIFSGSVKRHLLLFLSKEAGHFDEYVEKLKEPAKKFQGQVLFVTIDTDDADHERIMEFVDIKKSEIPTMSIIELGQDVAKYKPENRKLTVENVDEFVSAFLEGKLSRHIATQELPEDWDKHPVKILVGTNFEEVAYDKTKNVLVEFYAPWCGHCEMLKPIYEALGEKYKDSEDLIIANMDATANEVQNLQIDTYPRIILFKKETNKAVEYKGPRTLEGLSKFVESDGDYEKVADEAEEEDEDDDVPRKDEL